MTYFSVVIPTYNRVRFADNPDAFAAIAYLHRANHGQFNTVGPTEPLTYGTTDRSPQPKLLPCASAGQAASQGYEGQFIGLGPTWNPALLESPAAKALVADRGFDPTARGSGVSAWSPWRNRSLPEPPFSVSPPGPPSSGC